MESDGVLEVSLQGQFRQELREGERFLGIHFEDWRRWLYQGRALELGDDGRVHVALLGKV